MGSRIELVVTDLDGTLWGVDHIVHAAALAAVAQLAERDIPVLAATARRSGPARQMLGANGLSLPAVLLDGALVRDGSWSSIHVDGFDPPAAVEVLDVFRRHDVEPCVGVLADDEIDERLGPRPSSHPDYIAFLGDWSIRTDLDTVVVDEVVQSFSVCGVPLHVVQPIADDLARIAAPIVNWDAAYDAHSLTVGPAGVNKWRGVQAYCAHRGLDDRSVLAVGDGLNDLEMLRAAAVACVIRGSDARVEACADYLVDGPALGGWADIIDYID